MAIFNSYVKLPEANWHNIAILMGKILTNRWKLSPTILLNKPEKKIPMLRGWSPCASWRVITAAPLRRSSKSICARPNGTCEEAQLLLLRTWLHQTPPRKTNMWIHRWNFWMSPSFKIRFHQKKDRIWVNYNISLTWIKAIWGWFSLLTMIPVRSQWGRYNLPRLDYVAKKFGFHPDFINDGRSWDVFMGHLIFSFVWEYGIPKPSG